MNEQQLPALTTALGWDRRLPLARGNDLSAPVEVDICPDDGMSVVEELEAPYVGVRIVLRTLALTVEWCDRLAWELSGVEGVVLDDAEVDEEGRLLIPAVRPEGVCADYATWRVTSRLAISHGSAYEMWWVVETGGRTERHPTVELSLVEAWQLLRVLMSVLAWQEELGQQFEAKAAAQRGLLAGALGLGVPLPLFPPGSRASVWASRLNGRALRVTCGADGVDFSYLDDDGPARVQLVVDGTTLCTDDGSRLEELLAGVLPEHVEAGCTAEVVLVEPDEITPGTCVWKITDDLSLVHADRDETYLSVRGQVRVDDVRTLDLSAAEAWALVCALVSVREWQLELAASYEGAATARRGASIRTSAEVARLE